MRARGEVCLDPILTNGLSGDGFVAAQVYAAMPGPSASINSKALRATLPVICMTVLACEDALTRREAAPLEIVSGNGQAGAPSTTLTKPLSVAIRDKFGNSSANIVVYWHPSDGGFVFPDSS